MIWANGQLLQSNKYQVKRQIGGGGFGLTYLAEDLRLQRQVVIKAPNRTFENDQDYEKFVRRFQREGQVLAKINHPNVVRVIELFEEAGIPCLVMEYVEGETLNQLIRRIGPLPEEDVVRYFRELATALHTVHQVGLIHCDIHPSNIMLQQGTEPRLIDFGSTKSLQPTTDTVTTTDNVDYTPYEQNHLQPNRDPQPTWDIYGLAATLYFTVTGQKPQPAIARKLYGDSLKPPQAYRPKLSRWLNQAILSGMALEAQERSPSMQAWLGLLQPPQPTSWLRQIIVKPPLPQPLQPAPQPQPIMVKPPLAQPLQPRPGIPTPLPQPLQPRPVIPTPRLNPSQLTPQLRPVIPTPRLNPSQLIPPSPSIIVTPQQQERIQPTLWIGLGFVLVGCIPIGMVTGLSNSLLLSLSGALSGSLAGVGVLIWFLDDVDALIGCWALAGALAGALIGAGAWPLAWPLAWAWAAALAGVRENWVFSLILFTLGGAISGSATGISIWAGLGMGLLPLAQSVMILGGGYVAYKILQERYHPFRVFLIYSFFSVLGLAVGGGIGWWLKLSGVRLPT